MLGVLLQNRYLHTLVCVFVSLLQTACGFIKHVIRARVVFCLNICSKVESTAGMMPCYNRNLAAKVPLVWFCSISGCPTQQVLPVLTRQFASIGLLCSTCLQAPVAVCTAGKTSSGPGLTGNMLKKPNGQFYLEVRRTACTTPCTFIRSLCDLTTEVQSCHV